MQRLGNKVAVVTGGGSGLGRGIALAFAREGARVVVVGRREAPLAETAARIEREGGAAAAFAADVADDAAVARVAAFAAERFGGVQALACAAGVRGAVGPVTDFSLAGWEEALAVNLT